MWLNSWCIQLLGATEQVGSGHRKPSLVPSSPHLLYPSPNSFAASENRTMGNPKYSWENPLDIPQKNLCKASYVDVGLSNAHLPRGWSKLCRELNCQLRVLLPGKEEA